MRLDRAGLRSLRDSFRASGFGLPASGFRLPASGLRPPPLRSDSLLARLYCFLSSVLLKPVSDAFHFHSGFLHGYVPYMRGGFACGRGLCRLGGDSCFVFALPRTFVSAKNSRLWAGGQNPTDPCGAPDYRDASTAPGVPSALPAPLGMTAFWAGAG